MGSHRSINYIVVVEFNPRLKNKTITIPYDPKFERGKKLLNYFMEHHC